MVLILGSPLRMGMEVDDPLFEVSVSASWEPQPKVGVCGKIHILRPIVCLVSCKKKNLPFCQDNGGSLMYMD